MITKLLWILLFSLPLFANTMTVEQGMFSLAIGSFVAGVLLTFTPCVLPMVPILSSIIIGQGKETSTKKSFMLSLSYVLGTAFTYTIMGALAGATGQQLQAYFQNVWAIGMMSLIFALMALSMFGIFTIELPSFIQSRLNKNSNDIKGGSLPMVFLLGMVSALILGACVSPVLISFLGVAIAKGDALLGAIMMFAMALGMGVPLLILGFGAGKLLPKVGTWMDSIKYVFGFLLLAVSVYLFSTLNIVPPLILWGIYLIGIAIFIGTSNNIKKGDKLGKLLKASAIISFLGGILLLVIVAYGKYNITKPASKTSVSSIQNQVDPTKTVKQTFFNIPDMKTLDTKLKKAKDEGKMALLYFYHDYCPVCKHLKETTWEDDAVKNLLSNKYLFLSIDMTDSDDADIESIKKRFSIFGPPGFVFFNSNGEELKEDSFYGYLSPEDMFDTLDLLAE